MKVSSYTNKQLSTKCFLYINYWEEFIFFAGLFLFITFYANSGTSITWASGRRLGPGNFDFFGPNPLPLALVMDLPVSIALRTGPYKP